MHVRLRYLVPPASADRKREEETEKETFLCKNLLPVANYYLPPWIYSVRIWCVKLTSLPFVAISSERRRGTTFESDDTIIRKNSFSADNDNIVEDTVLSDKNNGISNLCHTLFKRHVIDVGNFLLIFIKKFIKKNMCLKSYKSNNFLKSYF